MPVLKIKKGSVEVPVDGGQFVDFMALTLQASYSIESATLANLVYLSTGKTRWNKNKYATGDILINGLVSGGAVIPGAADKVSVALGVVNINGVAVSFTADSALAITRPANTKYAIGAVTVSTAGALAFTKGTDGDAYDWTGGYGGAGQMPLVATNVAVIAYVGMYDDDAGVVDSSQIIVGESANVPFNIDWDRGGIIFSTALVANHTGPVRRNIYARFYTQDNSLQPVLHIQEATLTIDRGVPVETTNNDSGFRTFEDLGLVGWKLDLKKYRGDQFWIEKMVDPATSNFFLKMYEDTTDTWYYRGLGILNGPLPISVAKRGVREEALSFQGSGELRKI